MMFVATPTMMDSHITVTVGINFRGWENFVTAKSTTKITKISTPLKLPTTVSNVVSKTFSHRNRPVTMRMDYYDVIIIMQAQPAKLDTAFQNCNKSI